MGTDHDDLEARFWGNCASTYGEETKQRVYMREMGFPEVGDWRAGAFGWPAMGQSIVDIGGGPVSVLLKMFDRGHSLVVDPGEYPEWVTDRYFAAEIGYHHARGECWADPLGRTYDLALIYNCLQHTDDPEEVIATAREAAHELRMFEWINIPPHEGHPQMLTADALDTWTGRKGRIKQFDGEGGCFGAAYILDAP